MATETDTAASPPPLACNMCGARDHRPLFRKYGYDLVACRQCGLAFVANPPGAEEIAALYNTEDYHGELIDPAHESFMRMRGVAKQHMRFLQRSVSNPAGLKLLDIGCSSGLFLDEARSAGFAVHGAELSQGTARFARDHFGLDVHAGDWRDAGYADGQFVKPSPSVLDTYVKLLRGQIFR